MTAADKVLGVETEVLPVHDGELEPTLENRKMITRAIRRWNADIVIAHRPWDYHPDHRYVGVLVQDSAYMVAVPMFLPDTPGAEEEPCLSYIPAMVSRSRTRSSRRSSSGSMKSTTARSTPCTSWHRRFTKAGRWAVPSS